MKKRICTIMLSIILALCVLPGVAACGENKTDGNVDYRRQSYEVALDIGFEGTYEEWIELLKGEKGADGKDAYRLAVESAGFEGTLEQWLASLKGESGKDGVDGKDGEAGADGRGIVDVKIEDGKLYVLYSDGDAYVEIGVVKGEDGADGKDGEAGADGYNGKPGTPGKDGKDGTKILSVYIQDGQLYVFYSDGSEHCAGTVLGEKGADGQPGRGVEEFKLVNGVLYARYSDSSEFVAIGSVQGEKGEKGDTGAPGEDGKDGENGKDGVDGRGIVSATVRDGKLYVMYTDSTEYEYVGEVKGEKGEAGADGKNLDINEVYAAAKEGGYTGTLLEFISAYLNVEVTSSTEQIVGKTLLSTVAIASKYDGNTVPSGSGVIYKGDKSTGDVYIITNFHMVFNGKYTPSICNEIYVFFYGMPFSKLSKDNTSYTKEELSQYLLLEDNGIKAKYVAGSKSSDIAILKIENCEQYKKGPYRPAELIEDSDLIKEGETAYVVGNAEGMGISAASGIISLQSSELTLTLDSTTNEQFTYRVIRTDAAVNHGNSGGGLYNKDGKLMGIVNAKTQSATVDNMGYALPLNAVMGVVHNLLTRADDNSIYGDSVSVSGFGYNKCLLGITVKETDGYADYDPQTGLVTSKSNVVVVSASETGVSYGIIMEGDVIKSVEVCGIKRDIFRKYQIGDLLLYAKHGDVAKVTLVRDGIETTVEVALTSTTYMK